MGETLIFAIWVASATTFEVAMPLHGIYQVREFPNSEAGVEKMFDWANSTAHDKIDQMWDQHLPRKPRPSWIFPTGRRPGYS